LSSGWLKQSGVISLSWRIWTDWLKEPGPLTPRSVLSDYVCVSTAGCVHNNTLADGMVKWVIIKLWWIHTCSASHSHFKINNVTSGLYVLYLWTPDAIVILSCYHWSKNTYSSKL
jgi:hypothetical protein